MSKYWIELAKTLDIKPAKREVLDHYGKLWATPRKKYLWFIKEPDYFYRKRLLKVMRGRI